MYKVIKAIDLKKYNQYKWFRNFSNPCYGFNVKMDVTNLVEFSKKTKTKFFINTLYLVTRGLNTIEEMRLREVNNEIRLYDSINPTFTVMTDLGVYENTGFKMIDSYQDFYKKALEVLNKTKSINNIKEGYNDSKDFDDYYITCIPWLSLESMTHPLIDNDYASLSCPRVCWDKYIENNGKVTMTLNITVSHTFVDGKPLSDAFKTIQEMFSNPEKYLK